MTSTSDSYLCQNKLASISEIDSSRGETSMVLNTQQHSADDVKIPVSIFRSSSVRIIIFILYHLYSTKHIYSQPQKSCREKPIQVVRGVDGLIHSFLNRGFAHLFLCLGLLFSRPLRELQLEPVLSLSLLPLRPQ
jgi:hypothetical protein